MGKRLDSDHESEIRRRVYGSGMAAHDVSMLLRELDALRAELAESARLHGIGSSREARHLAVIEELKRELEQARRELRCQNRRCPAHHEHSNVWCDHVIQMDLEQLRTENAELRAAVLELAGAVWRMRKWIRIKDEVEFSWANKEFLIKVSEEVLAKHAPLLERLKGDVK